ncbi:DUF6416 domain-containing protein [Streptomyces sp. NPDC054766]
MLEYLLRNPGREIHCTELVDKALDGPNGVDPARRVAGVLSGMSKAHGNSGRRFRSPGGRRLRGCGCDVRGPPLGGGRVPGRSARTVTAEHRTCARTSHCLPIGL